MDTLVGRRLGKYQIESLVGRGGMATVYRAHDTVLNRSVAIKVLDPALAIDPKAVERFRREAVTAANLEHPSIVRVYDVQQEGNLHYIAMRYVHGTTLREILRDNGPLPLDAILTIIRPVAEALHYAHRHGVIHRDVKPGNILVEPDGSVLLTDFGIARAADGSQSGLTATGNVMGTADYLAPEQISGRPADPRSDIYSLGIVLYEMLTGVTPFAGENTATILYKQVYENPPPLRAINPRLPVELQPIIDRALAKNPNLRYPDALELARDLEEVARWLPAGSPWLARPQPPGPAPAHDGPRRGSQPHSQPYVVQTSRHQGPAVVRTGTGPSPYIDQVYSESAPHPLPVVVAPPRAGRRTMMLIFALLTLATGTLVLAIASGLVAVPGGEGVVFNRFQAPGRPVYTGPTRQGNGQDIHVPKALVPPAIDGDLTDWEGASPGPFPAPHVTEIRQGVKYEGANDLSAEFYFAWDDNNFYVAAVITDDVHVQFARTRGYDLYKGDDVELWFDTDLAGDFASREGNADDFQLGMSPGDFGALGPEAVFWRPNRVDARNKMVDVAARRRANNNGYTLEARVPWAAFGEFRPQPGQAIGFAASAGDNDRVGEAVQEVMISTTPNLVWNRPATFGNLFF
jgi:serine/threonine-protein kinase